MTANHMSQVATDDPPDLIDDDDDFKTAQGPKALPTASSNVPLSSIPTAITHSDVYNCDEMSLMGRADKISRGQIFEGKGSNKKGWVDEEITCEWLQRWSDVDMSVSQTSGDIAEQ